jgi:hypothetical protein
LAIAHVWNIEPPGWMLLQVYRKTVEPLVHTLFQNGKATCFAYGQTGSGKTFTMSPLPIRAAADILMYLARPEYQDTNLFVSCFEIYGNKLYDLLNMRKKLNILEDGKKKVVVVGLKVQIRASLSGLSYAQATAACLQQLRLLSLRDCLALKTRYSTPSLLCLMIRVLEHCSASAACLSLTVK